MITVFLELEIQVNKKICEHYHLTYDQNIVDMINCDFIQNYKKLSLKTAVAEIARVLASYSVCMDKLDSRYLAFIILRDVLSILSKNEKYMIKTRLIVMVKKELFKLFIL